MATTSATRPLLRVVWSLLLALAATVLSVGSAQAQTPVAGHGAASEFDPRGPESVLPAQHPVISVLLANGHTVFRSGLRAVIGTQPDIDCVAEVGDGVAVAEGLLRHRPDVAILDLDMPGLDDAAAAETVAALGGRTRILALATADTDENLYRALRLGTSGFLTKGLPARDLIAAIRTAARGHALLDPHRTRTLIVRLSGEAEPFRGAPEAETLTAREHEVLLLIAKARTNPEIARALGVGEQTVKTHVSHLLAKLGVRDRVHAAVYAHTHRLVPRESG
ncbi:DNA-binding NarL/FixJ family response regulator [Nocardia transvalensis]|uniref:DNA-binding NarL/FixJ family response regulator n=1 Tax=Nocardia transvalensis TaxID=37333 RepID=A0A7W9PKX2_9NOCA|nr:response regulator transcription factor [Nocardia transvalensis]MBB5917393.1 DNA-binding NarL/FixJ family response regulator [Nocardia transvalensis]